MSVKGGGWFEALAKQGLDVRTAADAAKVGGWLDTGCYALNWAISGRFLHGYPLGHTVEIFGDPSAGKSYLVCRAIAEVQAQNGVALLDDTEGSYSAEWMTKLGIDTKRVAYTHSDTVKDHLDTATGFIQAYSAVRGSKKLGPGLLALDSLAQLTTEHEKEVRLSKPDLSKAKEVKGFFRLIAGELHGLPLLHLSTNHVIANVGDLFNKRTTAGGGGPKYQSSVRIDLRTPSRIKGDTDYVGVWCNAFIEKNRIAPPWKQVRLVIPFYQPISKASGLISALVGLGILEKHGEFLRYHGEKLGRAYVDKKDNALRQDELGEQILDQVPELLEEADAYLATQTPMMSDVAVVEEEE